MTTKQQAAIIQRIDSLPSLPATVSRVMDVIADPESHGEDLVNAILPDQTMCAAILKIANSAFFGIPREVATMDKAVNVLGFNEVHNIVLGKAVFNSFQKIPQASKKIVDTFWLHSFHCGLAAKLIAEDLGCPPSELFIAGLIHDIGKLALFLNQPEDYLTLNCEDNVESSFNCNLNEKDQFGLDHCETGIILLTRWMFPEQLITTVGYHHQPEMCTQHTLYTLIIQISDLLSIILNHDDAKLKKLYPQFTALIPNGPTLWKQHNLTIDEKTLQKWSQGLLHSIEKDSAILNVFTS